MPNIPVDLFKPYLCNLNLIFLQRMFPKVNSPFFSQVDVDSFILDKLRIRRKNMVC